MIKTELTPQHREAYEQYVKTMIETPASETKLVAALEKLVKGSDDYDFLYIITKQKLNKGAFNVDDKKLFKSYLDEQRRGY